MAQDEIAPDKFSFIGHKIGDAKNFVETSKYYKWLADNDGWIQWDFTSIAKQFINTTETQDQNAGYYYLGLMLADMEFRFSEAKIKVSKLDSIAPHQGLYTKKGEVVIKDNNNKYYTVSVKFEDNPTKPSVRFDRNSKCLGLFGVVPSETFKKQAKAPQYLDEKEVEGHFLSKYEYRIKKNTTCLNDLSVKDFFTGFDKKFLRALRNANKSLNHNDANTFEDSKKENKKNGFGEIVDVGEYAFSDRTHGRDDNHFTYVVKYALVYWIMNPINWKNFWFTKNNFFIDWCKENWESSYLVDNKLNSAQIIKKIESFPFLPKKEADEIFNLLARFSILWSTEIDLSGKVIGGTAAGQVTRKFNLIKQYMADIKKIGSDGGEVDKGSLELPDILFVQELCEYKMVLKFIELGYIPFYDYTVPLGKDGEEKNQLSAIFIKNNKQTLPKVDNIPKMKYELALRLKANNIATYDGITLEKIKGNEKLISCSFKYNDDVTLYLFSLHLGSDCKGMVGTDWVNVIKKIKETGIGTNTKILIGCDLNCDIRPRGAEGARPDNIYTKTNYSKFSETPEYPSSKYVFKYDNYKFTNLANVISENTNLKNRVFTIQDQVMKGNKAKPGAYDLIMEVVMSNDNEPLFKRAETSACYVWSLKKHKSDIGIVPNNMYPSDHYFVRCDVEDSNKKKLKLMNWNIIFTSSGVTPAPSIKDQLYWEKAVLQMQTTSAKGNYDEYKIDTNDFHYKALRTLKSTLEKKMRWPFIHPENPTQPMYDNFGGGYSRRRRRKFRSRRRRKSRRGGRRSRRRSGRKYRSRRRRRKYRSHRRSGRKYRSRRRSAVKRRRSRRRRKSLNRRRRSRRR